MALIVADRIKETSTTTGTGAFTLAGAMTAFQAFSAVCTSPSDTCYYCIQAVDSGGNPTGEWEVGLGTYSAANTLTRTTVLSSSNAGSAVSFSAGTKQVWIDITARTQNAAGAGVAFPASPTTGDTYWRTDRSLSYFYNGTRWLTTNQYVFAVSEVEVFTPMTSTRAGIARGALSITPYDFWAETFSFTSYTQATNNSTNYWTVGIDCLAPTGSPVWSISGDTKLDTATYWTGHDIAIGQLTGANASGFQLNITKVGTPGGVYPSACVRGRLVG